MQRAIWILPFLLGSSGACSHGVGPTRQADGGYQFSCKGPLVDCLKQAERLCREDGYTVTSGHDRREMLGHESGQSQVTVRKSDAIVYCGHTAPEDERPAIRLQREEAAPAAALPAPAAPAPAAPTRVCVPGATQACVGPGGCSGGQACAADGSQFEACNCSKSETPPAAAPSP
jgi:hypothetical protein